MKFLIITHAGHGLKDKIFSYGPYVREMNLWTKYAKEVIIVAAIENRDKTAIDIDYSHSNLRISKISKINFQTFSATLRSLYYLPALFFRIFKEMNYADHIHLRCPGNIGLIGCIAQICYPSKQKSAKYAGNWDPNSTQPISYRMQRWILANTFLTKNMTVLIYGEWPKQTANIKSFFTATYSEDDKEVLPQKKIGKTVRFLFVGTLSEGKRPLYALKLVESLCENNVDARIDFFGEGAQREKLEDYIRQQGLQSMAVLHGNKDEVEIRKAYNNSAFLILPSKSEGWPKVIAEAMFWGVVPVASSVSCVPNMLGFGERGILLTMDVELDTRQLVNLISCCGEYEKKSVDAQKWSEYFTLDLFEAEISKILLK